MKIYTKTGDKGNTGLIGGTRVPKNDIRIEAYGTVDELNSYIGLLATFDFKKDDLLFIEAIQHQLFVIGSYLATDQSKTKLSESSVITEDDIQKIENEIDRLNQSLPELTAFILPGGSEEGAICHICRTIARRAERRVIDVSVHFTVDSLVIMFLNRLSDYFFVLSRFVTLQKGKEEIFWNK